MGSSASPLKILIIRFSSIGDIVLTTPVIRCLKLQLGAEIHYLTKRSYADLLAPNPYIDQLWLLDEGVSTLLDELRRERFDQIVDLHKNLRSWRIRMALGRPARSFPKLNVQKWLLVNLKIDRMPEVHIVDRYFQAVRNLEVSYDGAGLDHFLPEDGQVRWGLSETGEIPDDLVSIALGGAHATKRLPDEKMEEICRGIRRPIVLLGGPAEQDLGERLAALSPERIYNRCGKGSLHDSARWIGHSRVLITHDTGMMHIGAALKKPVISIWGNTVPAFGMYPFYPTGQDQGKIMEVQGLSCRPCSKIGYEQCPKGHFRCMRDQDSAQIIRLAEGR